MEILEILELNVNREGGESRAVDLQMVCRCEVRMLKKSEAPLNASHSTDTETLKMYVSGQVNFFRERYAKEIGSLNENVLNLTKLHKEKKRKEELYVIDETRRRENL